MKTTINSYYIATGTFVVMLLMMAQVAAADPMVRFCGRWTTTYVDAGFGEDYMSSPLGNYLRPARFAKAAVYKWPQYNNPEWSGYLDIAGCTPYIEVESGGLYWFSQSTEAMRNSRKIIVNPDNQWWSDDNPVTYFFLRNVGSLNDGQFYTHAVDVVLPYTKANVMGVATQVLYTYSDNGYPSGVTTRILTDHVYCDCGAYQLNNSNDLCIVVDDTCTQYAWNDISTWKFIIAHEIGHSVGAGNLDGDVVYSEKAGEDYCNCNHVGGYGRPEPNTHCLQSREVIYTAQAEGFANFFAAAIMNQRNWHDGIYVNAKPAYAYSGNNIVTYQPPVWFKSWSDNFGVTPTTARWMENQCNPSGDEEFGTELDWMRFYYDIWTSNPSQYPRLQVDEMIDIWDNVGNHGWDNQPDSVLHTVEDLYPSKALGFLIRGIVSGVDHG